MSATVRTAAYNYNGHIVELFRHHLGNTYGRNGNAGGTPKYYWSAKVDGKKVASGQRLMRLAKEVAHGYIDAEKTGDCYEVAVQTAEEIADGYSPEYDGCDVWVCHGRPTGQGPIEGVIHGHAWVEVEYDVEIPAVTEEQLEAVRAKVDGPVYGASHEGYTLRMATVIDRSNGKDMTYPRELYYSIGRMDYDDVDRYTIDEARDWMSEYGHYGPWDE